MFDECPDDCPTAYRLARREVVFGGLSVVGGAAFSMLPEISVAASWSPQSSAQFMEISSLLIPHRLREEVGKRLGAAMSAINPSLSDQIGQLLAIAKQRNARIVEDFFPDIPDGPLKQTALAIISAWYLGVVTDSPDAEVFAYADALMYGPTSDVMTVPSYAISGPNEWPADAPPLDSMPKF
jgi:fructose 5-dehydrogenase small subunit